MYYPYLRARQFELISLRELAIENILQGYITPVIEPVKETFNNLDIANKIFVEKGLDTFLIINPIVGEHLGDTEHYLDYLDGLEESRFLPAFHYKQNSQYIKDMVEEYNLNNCMVICYDNFVEDDRFRDLCGEEFVTHIMLFDPSRFRSLDRYLRTLNKNYIRLDDVFEKQVKNSDFLDIPAHKFTEEHLYYKEEGYQGFSDFTTLPSEYIDGGSTPRAVVIHFTYLNENKDNQIWIRHFTSDTNDSIANVQGKFREAAEKAIAFCDIEGISNTAVTELRNYLDEGRYPGLGTVKKISIKNHLNVVNNYLL
ncbi:sce7725 family protein [Flavobacterium salilacus subsp. salilacus]|uniref:sce7725 family protein n=1 Tax=Flavobacterium TaxID=237 RepID=UPI001074C50A|nr:MULTISPECIES: sce7725 family protein [Flavobacterium]KAF2518183.1 sce7725 family protein [Flavobacterium salilacus subsp. salilacus]MBE1615505.1 sce7725 family protein [Flavobacterium sp. SaA2.13]